MNDQIHLTSHSYSHPIDHHHLHLLHLVGFPDPNSSYWCLSSSRLALLGSRWLVPDADTQWFVWSRCIAHFLRTGIYVLADWSYEVFQSICHTNGILEQGKCKCNLDFYSSRIHQEFQTPALYVSHWFLTDDLESIGQCCHHSKKWWNCAFLILNLTFGHLNQKHFHCF